MSGAWERYWFGERPLVRVALFRLVVLAATLWSIRLHAAGVLQSVDGVMHTQMYRDWRPIWIFQALALGPPDPAVARAELVLIYPAIAAGLIGFWTRTSCAIAAVLSLHWLGVAYSFGKPHHDFVGTAFALAALPVAPIGARYSVDAWMAARRGEPIPTSGAYSAFPLRVAQVSMAIGYGFAGASKLAIGGVEWMNGYSLQAVMLSTSGEWSRAASQSVALCRVMSIGSVLVQLLFPVVLFVPVTRWLFVPGVIAFHFVSGMTVNTGTFLSLWFTLAAFVPLERLVRKDFWVGTPCRILRGAVIAVALLAVACVYFSLVPVAWISLAAVPWLAEHATAKLERGRLASLE